MLGSVSDDVFPIAVHEYVHLVAQHLGLNLPPWLNEEVPDVCSVEARRQTGFWWAV